MVVSLATFSSALARFNIPKTATVAVAVSGGCDSIALTYLAKNTFRRVLGITVDHKLRSESSDEAARTREIVERMGVQHHTVELEWPEEVPQGKIQSVCRTKRYNVLSKISLEHGADVLITGHHLNDQIETFLYRMARGSGITGLAGIRPLSKIPLENPKLPLIRPLLNFPKEALKDVCIQNQLEWVEDASNSYPLYWRNCIRGVLSTHPELKSGIANIMRTCIDARDVIEHQTVKALKSMISIDIKHGFVYVDRTQFISLSSTVAMRFLQTIITFVSGQYRHLSIYNLQYSLPKVTHDKGTSVSHCTIFPINDKTIVIARAMPQRNSRSLTPIKVGETVLWDNRFKIKLKSLERTERGKKITVSKLMWKNQVPSEKEVQKKSYYIRHWLSRDDMFADKGVRKVRSSQLPHVKVRGGLPVIVDKEGKPVLIPHYGAVDRSAGVCCECSFDPVFKLENIIYNLS